MQSKKLWAFLAVIVASSTLYGLGIINVQSATPNQKMKTMQVIQDKENELNQAITKLKPELEERWKITKERLILVTGIEMMSRMTLMEKMRAFGELRKIKKFLEMELNLRDIENLNQ